MMAGNCAMLFVCAAAFAAFEATAGAGDDPFADALISYDQGANPAPGFTDPLTALGPPERFTGEGVFPGVVSVFNPPFGIDEIVSIGAGGHLLLRFNTPVTDDVRNPFGLDLLIFGNTGFIDAAFPGGIVGGLFGADGGTLEVSDDGINWVLVAGVAADGPWPTLGYLDAGPFDSLAGTIESNFTRPVDPSLTLADFMGLDNESVIELYAGSGGGVGIDLASVGIASISFVRISNPGDPQITPNVEIDALSDVSPLGDINMDGSVNVPDLLTLLAAWGPCAGPPDPCQADLDGDGTVAVPDLLILLANWG